jgi:hypothetical protein
MQEFESISASSYDPSALATKLTAKAAEGWSVVAIVPTGGDVTAFLSRDKDGATESSAAAEPSEAQAEAADVDNADLQLPAETEPAPFDATEPEAVESPAETTAWAPAEATPEAVSEPSGWAIAPEPATPTPEPTGVQPSVGSSTYQPSATPSYEPAGSTTPATSAPDATSYTPDPAPAPAVPAGWYADPAGRFELRYWDGSTWTEHVSRAGQQFTDPPVA